MVAINKQHDQSKEPRTEAGAVCPFCFKPLPFPAIYAEPTRGGVKRRGYQGWCFDCNRGAIVLQQEIQHDDFKPDPSPRWKIEKFKEVRQVYREDPHWTIIDAPATADPDPHAEPVIITGPGGDFTSATTDEQLANAISAYKQIMNNLATCGNMILDLVLHTKTK